MPVQHGPPHVAVDQQCGPAMTRKTAGQVAGHQRLALAGDGARDQHSLGIIQLRLDLDRAVNTQESLDAGGGLAPDRQLVLVVVVDVGQVGNDAEQGDADEGLDVPGALDPVVDHAEPECHAEEHRQADQQTGADDVRIVRGIGRGTRHGAVEQTDRNAVVETLGGRRLVEAVEYLGVGVLGNKCLVLEAAEIDLEIVEPHLLLLLLEILAVERLLGLAGLFQVGGEIGDGELDCLFELVTDGRDRPGDLDHLGVALQVALAEQLLALERLSEVGLEAGNGAMVADVGDLQQVATRLSEFGHLLGVHLEIKAVEMGGGAGGIDAFQAVGDEVQAVVERDQIVLLLILLQPLLLLLVLLLQLGGALLQEGDRIFIGAAAFFHQIVDKLLVETVRHQGGGFGIGMAGGDGNDEAAPHGIGGDAAKGRGRRRRAGSRLVLEVGSLEQFDLVWRERLDDFDAQTRAVEALEIGVDVDVGARRLVHDLVDHHDFFRSLELHGRPAFVHGRLLHLKVTQWQRDEQRQRQRDPEAFADDDVVIAQGAAFDGVRVRFIRRSGSHGSLGRGRRRHGVDRVSSDQAFRHVDNVAWFEQQSVVLFPRATLAFDQAVHVDGEHLLGAIRQDAGDRDGRALGDVGKAAGPDDGLVDRQGRLGWQRDGSGILHRAIHRDGARGIILHRNGDLRGPQETPFAVGVLDDLLGFVDRATGHVDITHEIQVDVAPGVDARNDGQIGLTVHHDAQAIRVGEPVDEIALGVGLVLGLGRGLGRRLSGDGREAWSVEAEGGGDRENLEKANAAKHEGQ